MADCVGIKDIWASGSGSTGYLNTAGGTKFTLRQRITDLTGPSPDIIGIAMGLNDAASPVANVQSELQLVLAAIRAVLPTTPIFVFGSFLGNVAIATIQALEAGLKTTVDLAAASDQDLFFVPVTGIGLPSDTPWIFGTGRSGATTGDGNADLYTGGVNGADAVHPTTAGHLHIGFRAADGIMAAIANKA
jgi:lysophospholipase L1-like esterase